MKRFFILLVLITIAYSNIYSQDKKIFTFEDMMKLGRISDPQISPNGEWILYTLTKYNIEDNKGISSIWRISTDGMKNEQIISENKSCFNPRFSPEGNYIAYISSKEGSPQIWIYDILNKKNTKITDISTGVEQFGYSNKGKYFAFISEVFPDCVNDDCNKLKNENIEKNKSKAKIFNTLPIRVWNYWKDNKRNHLFVVSSEGGTIKDLTPGDYDTPPIDLEGKCDFAFSPDDKELCFVKNTEPLVAISTNNDLFTVSIEGGEHKLITKNKANDNQPIYSPDGNFIAYRAMKRPGFEADKYDLMIYDRKNGEIKNLTSQIDLSINEFIWTADSKSLYFTSSEKLKSILFKIDLKSNVTRIIEDNFISDIKINEKSRKLIFLNQSMNFPNEIYISNLEGMEFKKLTSENAKLLSNIEMNNLEDFWFEGAGNTKVQGFIIKPPKFDQNKKYPAVFVVHGGPQGAWQDSWTYRWNGQLFASTGFVIIEINPRGSTGYGQKFCDEISGDWGGKVYEDLMKGLDNAIQKYKFIDAKNIAAAGASYGGYMMNWILGHTDRFKCLVTHSGVYNLESMYGSTEELWFVEWENKGTPWENKEAYEKFSPHNFAKNFKTPTLVIHGELDYRIPVTEGFQLFTALQRQGVPSKFLYFPDECHWIMKPQNSKIWYDTVFDWWKKWLEKQ